MKRIVNNRVNLAKDIVSSFFREVRRSNMPMRQRRMKTCHPPLIQDVLNISSLNFGFVSDFEFRFRISAAAFGVRRLAVALQNAKHLS
jgi:hypothetical protein